MTRARVGTGSVWLLAPGAALALGLAGWIPAASSAPVVRASVARETAPIKTPQVDPLHLSRITQYAERATPPRLLDRSPFAFDAPPPREVLSSPPRTATPAIVRADLAPAPDADAESTPALVGIAEQNGPQGMVRTAVLSDSDGTLRFLLVGQPVGMAFRVSAIESDRVVLTNARTGKSAELILK